MSDPDPSNPVAPPDPGVHAGPRDRGIPTVGFDLDGHPVEVPPGGSLLDALRERLGVRSAKDGCSPQGQCGCCTVWVDGRPRVACVTPVARVAGRSVTTVDGLPDAQSWAERFVAAGASQCGFCTPGIIMRVAALSPAERSSPDSVRRALLAHLCRCTGWQPIVDAVTSELSAPDEELGEARQTVPENTSELSAPDEELGEARQTVRAGVEGRVPQLVGPEVALGRGGFADDTAPADALVAVRRVRQPEETAVDSDDGWVVAATLDGARRASGKVQGRRTTASVRWPIDVPDGDWDRTLQTTWVEPAYLEPDAAWCRPGGEPATPLGNGGAFGGKLTSDVGAVARRLADLHGRAVRVLWTREDTVRHGPKRPPMAAGIRADGTGVVHVRRTPGIAGAITAINPGLEVHEVDVPGPPTSVHLRGAGWVEAVVLTSAIRPPVIGPDGEGPVDEITSPWGSTATAAIGADGAVDVTVRCGADLTDPGELVVLRSYCIGAAHQALGWVRSEAIAVDETGRPLDLTIRSFGVLRAVEVPPIHVRILPGGPGPTPRSPVNGSDAVFAAVAAAAWRSAGHPERWPIDHGLG